MTTATICGFDPTSTFLKHTTLWMPNLVGLIWLAHAYALGNPSWTVLEWTEVCNLT